MSIVEHTRYLIRCDRCGAIRRDGQTDFPLGFPTIEQAADQAREDGWLSEGEGFDPENDVLVCLACCTEVEIEARGRRGIFG